MEAHQGVPRFPLLVELLPGVIGAPLPVLSIRWSSSVVTQSLLSVKSLHRVGLSRDEMPVGT